MSDQPIHPLQFIAHEALYFSENFKNQNTLDTYLLNARNSLNTKLLGIHRYSRFEGWERDDLEIEISATNDLFFFASTDFEGGDKIQINITLGTYLALCDIVLSALSINSTFNPLEGSSLEAMRWGGGAMVSPVALFQPKKRYFDYELEKELSPAGFELCRLLPINADEVDAQKFWIGSFISRVPVDPSRLVLADTIVDIALCFIFLHEESHFRQGHLQFLLEDAENYSDEQLESILRCFEYQADQISCQGLVDIFCRPENEHMNDLPSYAATDWSWWFRCLLTAVGLAFVIMDIERKALGETYYPPPRIRLIGAFKAMQAVLIGKETYRSLNASAEYGENDVKGFVERSTHAMFGSLVDLTEFQISNAEIANLGYDPLWPLKSVFPDMACRALTMSQYKLQENDTLRKALEMEDLVTAENCRRVFGIGVRESMAMRDMSFEWLDELDKLIEESNGYRSLTEAYRRWDVRDIIS